MQELEVVDMKVLRIVCRVGINGERKSRLRWMSATVEGIRGRGRLRERYLDSD